MSGAKRQGIPQRRRSSLNPAEVKRAVSNNFITYATHGYTKVAVVVSSFCMCVVYYSMVENWSVVDCILFVVVTVSTVGYGTPHPTSDSSRLFTIFLMVVGVLVIFSSMINILRSGLLKLNKFLAKSMASRLKRTEKLFQRRLWFSFFWLTLCAFLGAAVFHELEDWSIITALYFVVQTSTTVGFGDLPIKNSGTKVFLCFYIIVSTALLALMINNLYTLIENRKYLSQRKQLLKLEKKLHFLADLNDGCGVSKFEFVLTILEHTGKLDRKTDIEPWLKKFHALDTDDRGILNQEQLTHFSERHAQECESEYQEIYLSTSNVESLPVAPRSVFDDLKVNMGLFTNEDLYEAENFISEPSVDSNREGLDGEIQEELPTPSGLFGRLRSSTNRRYSTAAHLSDEEDEEEEEGDEENGMPASPSSGRWSLFQQLQRQNSQKRPKSKRSTTTTQAQIQASASGLIASPVHETNSPLHSSPPPVSASPPGVAPELSPSSIDGIAMATFRVARTPSNLSTPSGTSPPGKQSTPTISAHTPGSVPVLATRALTPSATPPRSRASSNDEGCTYNALLEAVEGDLPDTPEKPESLRQLYPTEYPPSQHPPVAQDHSLSDAAPPMHPPLHPHIRPHGQSHGQSHGQTHGQSLGHSPSHILPPAPSSPPPALPTYPPPSISPPVPPMLSFPPPEPPV